MPKLIWLALLVGTVCVGQQPKPVIPTSIEVKVLHCPFDETISADGHRCEPPAPLKCGKYEHVDETCYADLKHGGCLPAKCVPDIKVLTMKEWQAVQQAVIEWQEFRGRLDAVREKMHAPVPTMRSEHGGEPYCPAGYELGDESGPESAKKALVYRATKCWPKK